MKGDTRGSGGGSRLGWVGWVGAAVAATGAGLAVWGLLSGPSSQASTRVIVGAGVATCGMGLAAGTAVERKKRNAGE